MLSSRARYATRAVLHLSLRHGQGPVAAQEIADRQNIPMKFLQQILISLKLAGFVVSRKGPGGGFTLARPPEQIMLGTVLRAMDGPLAPVSCVSVTRYEECSCPNPDDCTLRETFKEARDAMSQILDSTSFADLCQRAERVGPVGSGGTDGTDSLIELTG